MPWQPPNSGPHVLVWGRPPTWEIPQAPELEPEDMQEVTGLRHTRYANGDWKGAFSVGEVFMAPVRLVPEMVAMRIIHPPAKPKPVVAPALPPEHRRTGILPFFGGRP